MKHDELLAEILTLYNNSFDLEDEKDLGYLSKMIALLSHFHQFGIRALIRYKVTAKSNFFDYSHLMLCLRQELIKPEEAENQWGIITKLMGSYGKNADLGEHLTPLSVKILTTMGGYRTLAEKQGDLGYERKTFIDGYNRSLENTAINTIIDAELKCTK